MSLTKEDLRDLAQILQSNTQDQKSSNKDIMDMIFKGLSTLSIALIVWIFSTTNQLKQDVEIIKNNDRYTSESLKDLQAFTKQPRFTREDFLQSIAPIITNTNKNTLELNSRNEFMQSVESRLIKLEIKILENDKKK